MKYANFIHLWVLICTPLLNLNIDYDSTSYFLIFAKVLGHEDLQSNSPPVKIRGKNSPEVILDSPGDENEK